MPLLLLSFALALALDFLFGDPPNRFHPVAAMGAFIRWMENREKKEGGRKRESWLFAYGIVLVLSGLVIFTALPLGLGIVLHPYPWAAVVVNAILLNSAFSMRRLLEAGREVERALASGDLSEARHSVSWHLVSRDTRQLDAGHVSSAAVESLAENLADGFVAPLLAFLVGGAPLAWAYRFVNTADAMIGYHDERYENLGKFAARLDDVLNWIPSRLSGPTIALAAPLVGCSLPGAWRTMIEQHSRTASPNAGWPMSAMAGALGVTLEKIGYYRLEGGANLPGMTHIIQARRLTLVAGGWWAFISLVVLAVASH